MTEQTENELKKQLHDVELLNDDLRRALDLSSIVAITDRMGKITYVNDLFCKISGYSREELMGQDHRIVNSGHHPKDFFKELWSTISQGGVWQREVKNRAKDGSYYWVNTTVVPFLDENKKPYQYVSIRQDVTEHVLARETLQKERELRTHAEKMASLGEMAAGIAHELGNPTASIQAWLDVMEAHLDRGEMDLSKFLNTLPKVRNDAHRIRKIMRGMLTYARDGSDDPFISENISNLITQVQEYCAYKLRKSQVDVVIETSNPYVEIECRVSEISQVLVNMLMNACDAMQNSENKKITIVIEEGDSDVTMRFNDTGPGVAPEIKAKIFEPFFTTKSVGSGTGLGLSIVSAIIKNHNGTISIDSSVPYTSFVITIPKKREEG